MARKFLLSDQFMSSGSLHSYNFPNREQIIIVTAVVVLHFTAAMLWLSHPIPPAIVVRELSVSMAIQQAAVVQMAVPIAPVSQKMPVRLERVQSMPKFTELPEPDIAVQPETMPVVLVAVSTAPIVDSAPDYKASYLNNPRPPYPMMARRMGWGGKVILDVEVRSDGACGEIQLFKSSGHDVLDRAALNTVRSWRFVPARQGGQATTQWFRVPIHFSLEDKT